jgi:hypothetical protein
MYCGSSRGQLTRDGIPAWELGELLTTLTIETYGVNKTLHNASDLDRLKIGADCGRL